MVEIDQIHFLSDFSALSAFHFIFMNSVKLSPLNLTNIFQLMIYLCDEIHEISNILDPRFV